MITADTNNAPDWVDLSTPNLEEAANFYSRVLGWELERTPTPMGDYYIGRQQGHQVAGLMEQPPELEGAPPMWTMFINVADVDGTVSKAAEAGGDILDPPGDIPDGRVALVADPAGAMLGVIATPLEHSDEKWFSRAPGAVCWVELLTRDPEAASPFYAAVFGWEASTRDHDAAAYTVFELNGEDVAGMMSMPAEVPAGAPSHWATYFAVDDCLAIERRAVELGGKMLRATTEIDRGKFAVIEDPQGAKFSIMEYGG